MRSPGLWGGLFAQPWAGPDPLEQRLEDPENMEVLTEFVRLPGKISGRHLSDCEDVAISACFPGGFTR